MKKYYKPVKSKKIMCPVCKTRFMAKWHTKYCSPACKWLAQKERNRLLVAISNKKVCPKCRKDFMGPRIYCSRKCWTERHLSTSPDGIILKQCTNCKKIKPMNADNYQPDEKVLCGFASWCKLCIAEVHKQWAASDKGKATRSKNRKIYAQSDAHKQYMKKIAPTRCAHEAIRRKTDLPFALSNRMRCLMYSSLRGTKNGHKWQDLVGYSVEDLRRHIEKQFKKGMTWERFLAGEIHIDHKIPVSAHNFSKPEDMDFKKCWALKNLQPMWAEDNISKSNKLGKSFQPSLLLRDRI